MPQALEGFFRDTVIVAKNLEIWDFFVNISISVV